MRLKVKLERRTQRNSEGITGNPVEATICRLNMGNRTRHNQNYHSCCKFMYSAIIGFPNRYGAFCVVDDETEKIDIHQNTH